MKIQKVVFPLPGNIDIFCPCIWVMLIFIAAVHLKFCLLVCCQFRIEGQFV